MIQLTTFALALVEPENKTRTTVVRVGGDWFVAAATSSDVNAKLSGTEQLQVRCGANAERVLQSDPGRQGLRAELEEVHLQGDLEVGRPSAGVLQEPELPGAARMNQEVAWLLLFVVRGLARARRLPINQDQRPTTGRIASARRYTRPSRSACSGILIKHIAKTKT